MKGQFPRHLRPGEEAVGGRPGRALTSPASPTDPAGVGVWPLGGLVGPGGADVRDDGWAAPLRG